MKFKSIFFLLIAASLVFTACKKDYYKDSGIHTGVFAGTTYEYLQTKPELFDSLLLVIDAAEMRDVFNTPEKKITFFAPPNSSIFKAVKNLNEHLHDQGKDTVSNLNQIKPEVWRELLSLYVFEGKNMLKDYAQLDTLDLGAFSGQGYDSYSYDNNEGRSMNIGVIYNTAYTDKDETTGVKYAGYRQLWISYIYDFSDPIGSLINVPVASSNIEPAQAALHVLQFNKHVFGFTSSNFILTAVNKGIAPLPTTEE